MIQSIHVLVKQVPNMKSKAGMNADGTINRAQAKAMLNPFDAYALRAAVDIKKQTGAKITAITMGPPRSEETLIQAMEHGADEGVLLTDRRLAGSDTLATSYTISCCIKALGLPDLVLCGLQTTDGDTAHVGPQTAERLDFPQITYVENLELVDGKMKARRIIEGGHQDVLCTFPLLMTISNAAQPISRRRFSSVARVRQQLKNEESKAKVIRQFDLDAIGVDFNKVGIDGSPTIVSKTQKIGEKGGSCKVFAGSVENSLGGCMRDLAASELSSVFSEHLGGVSS